MDSPAEWSTLLAALHAAGLRNPGRTWTYLVERGLVNNRAPLRARYLAMVEEARRLAKIDVDGPSAETRLTRRLVDAEVSTMLALRPDPDGRAAKASWADFEERDPPPAEPVPSPHDEVYCQSCGKRTSIRGDAIRSCEHCGDEPVDIAALAVQLGHSSATVRICPRCGICASLGSAYCYYCGASNPDRGPARGG